MEGGLSDKILKEPIPANFDLIWFSGFRGQDFNVKVYNGWVRRKTHMAFGQVS